MHLTPSSPSLSPPPLMSTSASSEAPKQVFSGSPCPSQAVCVLRLKTLPTTQHPQASKAISNLYPPSSPLLTSAPNVQSTPQFDVLVLGAPGNQNGNVQPRIETACATKLRRPSVSSFISLFLQSTLLRSAPVLYAHERHACFVGLLNLTLLHRGGRHTCTGAAHVEHGRRNECS
ncbi:hypothetical protein B0H19DRAFT_1370434 [Mycena capillaripes]|nr:hypothetical protein B0H19DRAFT_1370434 [Mycena capillaripes]